MDQQYPRRQKPFLLSPTGMNLLLVLPFLLRNVLVLIHMYCFLNILEAQYVDWFRSKDLVIGFRTDMGGTLAFVDLAANTALKAPLEISDEVSQFYTCYLPEWELLIATTTSQGQLELFAKVNNAWASCSLDDDVRAVVRLLIIVLFWKSLTCSLPSHRLDRMEICQKWLVSLSTLPVRNKLFSMLRLIKSTHLQQY